MRIEIDDRRGSVIVEAENGDRKELALGSAEAFDAISRAWLRCGWDTKYVYSFTWMGRPVIQLPEDMLRVQEVLYSIAPDVIIETGIAHGGSLIFYASLFKAMGKGRVIGVDIEIRPHNRKAIEAHELYPLITMFEGSSTDPATVDQVKGQIRPGERVIAMLDSNHSKQHVLEELRLYGPMVSIGSYIIASDGIMGDLVGAPRSEEDWGWNNPKAAAEAFVAEDPRFVIEEPAFAFNEGVVNQRVTYWPSAYIKRVS